MRIPWEPINRAQVFSSLRLLSKRTEEILKQSNSIFASYVGIMEHSLFWQDICSFQGYLSKWIPNLYFNNSRKNTTRERKKKWSTINTYLALTIFAAVSTSSFLHVFVFTLFAFILDVTFSTPCRNSNNMLFFSLFLFHRFRVAVDRHGGLILLFTWKCLGRQCWIYGTRSGYIIWRRSKLLW